MSKIEKKYNDNELIYTIFFRQVKQIIYFAMQIHVLNLTFVNSLFMKINLKHKEKNNVNYFIKVEIQTK